MKILRYYWDCGRQKSINDLVLSVTRETKTQLIAIDKMHPNYEYRFRKPKVLQHRCYLTPVGGRERFSNIHYELYLEGV